MLRKVLAWPRFICMFMNQDKTIGGCIEKGLANLTAVAERHGLSR